MIVTIRYHDTHNLVFGTCREGSQYLRYLRTPLQYAENNGVTSPDAFFNAFLIEFCTIWHHDTHSITNVPVQLLRIGLLLKGLP
jgi:hypothetical protein